MPASALLAAASIASLNLCTDEYLLLLARPQEIASVSFLSQDPQELPLWKAGEGASSQPRLDSNRCWPGSPTSSSPWAAAGEHRRSSHDAFECARSICALSVPSMTLRPTCNAVAAALGDPGRAQPWLRRLSALQMKRPKQEQDAIWVGGGGQSIGVPSVGADWMRLAGLKQRPVSGGRVSLEDLLVRPPHRAGPEPLPVGTDVPRDGLAEPSDPALKRKPDACRWTVEPGRAWDRWSFRKSSD